jgi:hypothetical protein
MYGQLKTLAQNMKAAVTRSAKNISSGCLMAKYVSSSLHSISAKYDTAVSIRAKNISSWPPHGKVCQQQLAQHQCKI